MRILHILDHSVPMHSGYSFRTLAILKHQRAMGWETFHLTSSKQHGGASLEEEVDGLHFFRTRCNDSWLSQVPVFSQLKLMQQTSRRLDEVVRSVRPTVLHAHSPVLNALPAIQVGRRYNIPVVYEVRAFWEDAAVDHGSTREGSLRYRLTHWLETYALRRADAVTTICEGLRSDIVERGIDADKVTVIPNAVDIDQFKIRGRGEGTLRTRLGLDGKAVVGFLGSFYAYEGLDLLIKSLPLVLDRVPNVRILLVGGGPEEERLKRQAQSLGLADTVIFAGRVPHQQVADYYDLVDFLVYPRHSMRLTELVTPLKPLEAMAQGKVLIASDVGGHKELIRDGETGLLFRAGDQQDLADKIVKAVTSTESWDKIRAAGRHHVESERNWKNSVDRYRAVYETASVRPNVK